jgi:hypothetical protein
MFNLLNESGNYTSSDLAIINTAFCIYDFRTIRNVSRDILFNSVNILIFLMVMCGVLFEVRTEILNI